VRTRGACVAAAGLFASLITLACLDGGRAVAERTGGGGVVVSFNGSVAPNRLPRAGTAPITLTLSGEVTADQGGPPPRLSRLDVAFGARGGLETDGLPSCPRGRLRNATADQALARCGGALVGRGSIVAEVPLNPVEPLLAHARALAFNGRAGGRPAVWLLAYSASPPVSFVLPLYLRSADTGSFGISLRAPVAAALGRWPRLSSFQLTLGRRYRAGGTSRSYLNARCPLPPRFHFLSVPIARSTYRFQGGPTHSITILRGCGVRE